VIARLLGENTPGDAASGLKLPHAGNGKAGLKVLSTGGGAFVNDATRELILARGIAVWLDAELDTLVDRTARKGNRPLLKTGNPREISQSQIVARTFLFAGPDQGDERQCAPFAHFGQPDGLAGRMA
jgi:hypothetical protein